jgi:hypothetical protein
MESAKAWAKLTCEPSSAGVGLWRFRVFLAATFLTAVLALTEARGAADLVDTLLFEADLGVIGWLCITTFFKDGEILQKRTTGAVGRNLKGEPSSPTGSGPTCCCKEMKGHHRQSYLT